MRDESDNPTIQSDNPTMSGQDDTFHRGPLLARFIPNESPCFPKADTQRDNLLLFSENIVKLYNQQDFRVAKYVFLYVSFENNMLVLNQVKVSLY